MSTPEKSSDEILQELFGLCQQKQIIKTEDSSHENNSNEGDDLSKRHKHKKKKHKKSKKRQRSASTDSHDFDKKKKVKKEPDDDCADFNHAKIEMKIKKEKDEVFSTLPQRTSNNGTVSSRTENESLSYKDNLTGKRITLDDVFNTMGREIVAKIKSEKDMNLLTPDQIKKEKVEDEKLSQQVQIKDKYESEARVVSPDLGEKLQKGIADIFDDGKTEAKDSGSKKISIKNLKNSAVYEATMKEIEEREKQKAEKYEEGELSSSSTSSSDLNSLSQNTPKDTDLDDHLSHKNEKSLKNFDDARKKHRSHYHKKKRNHKEERKQHKSRKALRSSERSLHKSRNSKGSRNRTHHHHHHYHHHTHSPSVTRRSTSLPRKLCKSRTTRPDWKRDRSISRSLIRTKSNNRRSKSKSVERIDKQKLLEIARKNAINLLQQGALPASVIGNKNKVVLMKAGGKTVDELTDFCKQLSKKEAEGIESVSSNEEDNVDERNKPFHHPFQLKERPSSIVMNIKNAVSLPIKTAQEKTLELSKQLSLQYPVSSGQHHRTSESVWVPVEPTKQNSIVPLSNSFTSSATISTSTNVTYPAPLAITYPTTVVYQQTKPQENSILPPPPPPPNFDVSSVVAQRLEAIRRLSENPSDPVGTTLINAADSKMNAWAKSKVQPGLFTGSTGVKLLSPAELAAGCQAWPKKNQFTAAKPVNSDRGEALMKKMGWQPGEGLGKYKQGPSAPCEISLKTDRKGLAEQPVIVKTFKQTNSIQKAFEISLNKHPVSMLNEFCSRRKLETARYDCEEREGVGRRKLYLCSVTVQGMRYSPTVPSTNKKQSKMEAATLCLQSLGLMPVVTNIE